MLKRITKPKSRKLRPGEWSEEVEIATIQRLWTFLYHEPWREEWDIQIGNFAGMCVQRPTMIIPSRWASDNIDTLIHEFTHIRHWDWGHTPRFYREVEKQKRKVLRRF